VKSAFDSILLRQDFALNQNGPQRITWLQYYLKQMEKAFLEG
jgi:hypothetical protein